MSTQEINLGDGPLSEQAAPAQEPQTTSELDFDIGKLLRSKPKKSKEDVQAQQRLIGQILQRCNHPRFGSYLQKNGFAYTQKQLASFDVDELEELLERVRSSISARNNSSVLSSVVVGAVQTAEAITQNPRIKPHCDLAGLSQVLAGDESFADTIAELELDYSDMTTMGPEKRLLFTLVTASARVAGINRIRARFLQASAPISMPSFGEAKTSSVAEPAQQEPIEPELETEIEFPEPIASAGNPESPVSAVPPHVPTSALAGRRRAKKQIAAKLVADNIATPVSIPGSITG